ncbi:hypothetical protein LCGC14_1776390 [marine sediment metagenome]|uniref:Uncharacterized protein n=1 Tax=marine sediment metagenome TaxID=412755 RepID=A0A0F9JWE6_9ZZZZ
MIKKVGNSGKGLAVFGLIIALAGLGLGGYAVFTIMTAEDTTSIKGTWYDTVNFHETTMIFGNISLV